MTVPPLRTSLALLTAFCAATPVSSGAIPNHLSLPDGFELSLYADDELAHDIYSLTIDSEGRVVVSGTGYVRMLLDKDADGVADSFQTFADGPATGAQGMYFDGHDLYCTGDGGVLRYRDGNADGQADGPAEVLSGERIASEVPSRSSATCGLIRTPGSQG